MNLNDVLSNWHFDVYLVTNIIHEYRKVNRFSLHLWGHFAFLENFIIIAPYQQVPHQISLAFNNVTNATLFRCGFFASFIGISPTVIVCRFRVGIIVDISQAWSCAEAQKYTLVLSFDDFDLVFTSFLWKYFSCIHKVIAVEEISLPNYPCLVVFCICKSKISLMTVVWMVTNCRFKCLFQFIFY